MWNRKASAGRNAPPKGGSLEVFPMLREKNRNEQKLDNKENFF
jgi:hypothetical protein